MSLLRVSSGTNDDTCGRDLGGAKALKFTSSRTTIHGSQAFSLQGNPKSVAPRPSRSAMSADRGRAEVRGALSK